MIAAGMVMAMLASKHLWWLHSTGRKVLPLQHIIRLPILLPSISLGVAPLPHFPHTSMFIIEVHQEGRWSVLVTSLVEVSRCGAKSFVTVDVLVLVAFINLFRTLEHLDDYMSAMLCPYTGQDFCYSYT